MIEVKIDTENKEPMLLILSGSSIVVAREASIMMTEICKAIAKGTGNTFDEVLSTVVGAAKLAHFFKSKEEQNGH